MRTRSVLLSLVMLLATFATARPDSERQGTMGTLRFDFARAITLQGYAQLMESHPDTALVTFQRALARAQAERTPQSGGWWGLRLGYRLLRRNADAESVASRALPVPQPEVEFAMGWNAELDGDSVGAAQHYENSLRLDALFTPTYLRLARLRMRAGDRFDADSLFQQAIALGDTLAASWRARILVAVPPTPPESLRLVARDSPVLTRLQLASLLQRAGQLRLPLKFDPPRLTHFRATRDSLVDLAGSPWLSLARQAVELSGMELYPDGTFRPDDPVRRGAFALWLDRMSWEAPESTVQFPDVLPGDFRRVSLERAVRAHLLQARPDGRAAPGEPVSGPEAWQALRRLIPGLAAR